METKAESRKGRKPRDEIIRREVLRRLDTKEPINYRAIIGAVGGSPATVKRVLVSMGLAPDARGAAQHEQQIRERMREAHNMVESAEAYLRGAKESGDAIAREITTMLGMVKDAHGMLIREVETLRTVMGEVRRELAMHRPAQVGDPVLEAKLKKASAENGRMAQTIEQLKRRLHEAGVEDI